jgi:hypothetical protein
MMVQGVLAWDGRGTSTDPYLIKSSADWKQLAACLPTAISKATPPLADLLPWWRALARPALSSRNINKQ